MAKKNFTNILNNTAQQSGSFIKDHLQIDDEMKALIPPLADDELKQLEINLLKEGIREPLLVWKEENILVDGHNRFAIAQKHNLRFTVETKSFASREDVKTWMINNQLGRRNLTPEQASYLRGKRYETEKQQGKRTDLTSPQSEGKLDMGSTSPQNEDKLADTFPQNEERLNTAEKLAKEYNVGRATIERDALFAKGLDKIGEKNANLKSSILAGKVKIKKTDIQKLAQLDDPLPPIEEVEDIEVIIQGKDKNNPKGQKKPFVEAKNEVLEALQDIHSEQDERAIQRFRRKVLHFLDLLPK